MALSKEISFPNSKLDPTETALTLPKLTTVESCGGIKCDVCKITFSTKKPYDLHYLNHCNDKTKLKYTCVVCDKTYPAYQTFHEHCYIQHILKNKFKCPQCAKCFPKVRFLNEHVSTAHTFRCVLRSCKKHNISFNTKAELQHHQMTHSTSQHKPPYPCHSCKQLIHTSSDCETHIDSHFAPLYSCPICNQHITKNNATTHLTTHFGAPNPSEGRQAASEGRPAASEGRPADSEGRPVASEGRQAASEGRPADSEGRPVASEGRPAASEGRPADSEGRPVASEGRQAASEPHDAVSETPSHSSVNTLGGVRCAHCNQLFNDKMEIDLHFMRHHKDEPITYTCNICKKQFGKYSLFGDHCYFHYCKTRFQCEKCSRSFDRLSYLVSHSESCSTSGPSFACSECSALYRSERNLQRHLRTKHHATHRKCVHPGCTQSFASQKELVLHRKRAHDSRSTWCQSCGMHFQSLQACLTHLDVHRKQEFHCPVCDHLTHDKHKLMQHIPKHFAACFYACKVCGKIYEERRRFLQHTKTHDDVKTFMCNYCGKSFAKSNHLQQHVNVHTGMKPYKCVACPKTFASYPNWNKHLRKIHNIDAKTVERPDVSHIDQANENLPKIKANNLNNVDEFQDDSMESDSDIENEINEIEKSLSDRIETNDDLPRGNNYNADVKNRENNETSTVNKICKKTNDTATSFDIRDKTGISDGITVKYENIANNEVAMALEEHLDDGALDDTESEILEGLLDIGVLPEAPNRVMSVEMPQMEYGPEFINADSMLPMSAPGEVINLDDHLLPHIDPLLTIKCEAPPDCTHLATDTLYYDYNDANSQITDANQNYDPMNDVNVSNPLYLYDQNDLSDKNDAAQPNLVWGPTTIEVYSCFKTKVK